MSVDLESVSEATSGAIGALLSTTILYPLDTCKTRYQAEVQAHGQQKYRSIIIFFLSSSSYFTIHLSIFFWSVLRVFFSRMIGDLTVKFVMIASHSTLDYLWIWLL
ncbi:hypothetical protein RHGRI_014550 [Rhododendron griersonianum]|uniref:Uncharacterized protein n=1 Tax=Rhododendron griersonianum TaxID=479676 RepID=A0AAV6K9R6_9ERIC|nr:hypothetical protein RHGRI_014550 [Rhododendron griersonianum]